MTLWTRIRDGPRDKASAKPEQRWPRLVLTYAPDWLVTIVFVALVGTFASGEHKGLEGFRREFSLTDTSLQHTFAVNERISFELAIGLAGAVPWGCMILYSLLWRRSFWDMHNSSLGFVLACSMTTVITEIVKVTVGRPRPDIIDRCQPAPGSANGVPYGLVTAALCTRTDLLTDGFKSFPSGHSSFSFAGLGFFALYIAGKVHLFDRNGHAIKAWIAMIPILGAALIAISRTMDNRYFSLQDRARVWPTDVSARHHATDVLVGGLLGFLVANLTYHLYYPPLGSHKCHLPFAPRIKRDAESPATTQPYIEGTVARPSECERDSDTEMALPLTQHGYTTNRSAYPPKVTMMPT